MARALVEGMLASGKKLTAIHSLRIPSLRINVECLIIRHDNVLSATGQVLSGTIMASATRENSENLKKMKVENNPSTY